ncbi:MAG: hypothetical protein KDI79_04680 [Anaerolineae bacterium]|nr:hypothetical protein [Anaerolineae bacterium]
MTANNLKNQLGDLFSGLKNLVIEPPTLDKEHQKDQLQPLTPYRETEEFIGSCETKSEREQVEDLSIRGWTSEWSSVMLFPQYSDGSSQGMILEQYLLIVWKWLWLIVVSTLIAATASFMVSSFIISPVYQASTKLMISVGDDYSLFESSEYLSTTYVELLAKDPVTESAAQTLDLDTGQIKNGIIIHAIPKTPLIELTVEQDDPRLAMEIANQMVIAFKQVARKSKWLPGSDLIVVEVATQPRTPISPQIPLNTVVAAVVGCALGTGAAFLIEFLKVMLGSKNPR